MERFDSSESDAIAAQIVALPEKHAEFNLRYAGYAANDDLKYLFEAATTARTKIINSVLYTAAPPMLNNRS